MTGLLVRAPGKLFLTGEYAVLEGAPAVVTTIGRWAEAKVVGAPVPRPSPIIRAVSKEAARELGVPPCNVSADSDLFFLGKEKLGLGSSAAVCAAAMGLQFHVAGRPVDRDRKAVLEAATRAHRSAQGGVGSGADVAASCLGGTICFAMSHQPRALPKPPVSMVVVWTGKSSKTKDLVRKVSLLKQDDPETHRAVMDEMANAANSAVEAYERSNAREIVALTASYGNLMQELGEAAKVEIVCAKHRSLAKLARDLGGAAKPSGAGGGDVAVAVFEEAEAAESFSSACARRGTRLVPGELHVSGLQVIGR